MRKMYGSMALPKKVTDGSRSKADLTFLGREFTYLIVLLKHQWMDPVIKYIILHECHGVDSGAGKTSFKDIKNWIK